MSRKSDAKTFSQSGTVWDKAGNKKQFGHGVSVEAIITPLNSGMGADVRVTFETSGVDGRCASIKKPFINDRTKTLSQFIEKEILPDLLTRINTVFHKQGEALINEYRKFVLDEIGLFYRDIDKIYLS
jgi:hypothetical protein